MFLDQVWAMVTPFRDIQYIIICCILSSGLIPRRLNFICRRFGTLLPIHTYPPMKTEQTGGSETPIYKIQTSRIYPEESIQHSENGESLKLGNYN